MAMERAASSSGGPLGRSGPFPSVRWERRGATGLEEEGMGVDEELGVEGRERG